MEGGLLQAERTDRISNGERLYVCMISVHGLIRGNDIEFGRDADNGGQIRYVLELTQALAARAEIERVDLVTRRIKDPAVDADYGQRWEALGPNAGLVRIDAGPGKYLPKEQLWEHLDEMVDNLVVYLREQPRLPDILHCHYADAGYVGVRVAHILDIPLIFTGHSLGRVKQRRMLAAGMSRDCIGERYNIEQRITAEESTLASAMRVITSTSQEISEQYEFYDFYQPERMQVIPPGTDLNCFYPPDGTESESAAAREIARFLREPDKPIILVLARLDARKNLPAHIAAYALNAELQEKANLVLVMGSRSDPRDLEPDAHELLLQVLELIDQHNLYGKVAYPKCPPDGDIASIYRLAAASGGVHVNAALTEPFGLTLIEAAASGLPIVATADGGPRDIIQNCDNGVLVNPLDPLDISAGICKVLFDTPRWRGRAKNGLAGVQEHYSWSAHARQYVDMARDVIELYDGVWFPPSYMPSRTSVLDRAFFTCIDQNLLGSSRESLAALAELIRANRRKAAFGIATARTHAVARQILSELELPQPDILISSAGTNIHSGPKLELDQRWLQHIEKQWTPKVVMRLLADVPGLQLQERHKQDHYKISYYFDPDLAPSLKAIHALLFREGQSVHATLSFGRFLDIVPIGASKGMALRHVAGLWNIPLENILVAGGSGIDEDMMRGNTLAVVVANRHSEELNELHELERVYFATKPHAGGILEAIDHYDFYGRCRLPEPPPKTSSA